MLKKKILASAIAGVLCVNAQAIDFAVSNNALELVGALVSDDITIVGTPQFSGAPNSAGFFTNGTSAVGLDGGIVFSTGDLTTASTDTQMGTAGIQAISDISGQETNDGVSLSFDFELPADKDAISFQYVFTSAEYNEYVGSSYNDGFVFLLDGENLALVPQSADAVTVNNINQGKNANYYVNNTGALPADFEGRTVVLVAGKEGLSSGVHTLELAIADAADSALDSWVLLNGGSLSAEILPIIFAGNSAFDSMEKTTTAISTDQIKSTTSIVSRNTSLRVRAALAGIIKKLRMRSREAVSSVDMPQGRSAGDSAKVALSKAVWASPGVTHLSNRTGRGYTGDMFSFSAGYDINLREDAVLGVSLVIEDSDNDYDDNNGSTESKIGTLLVYGGKALADDMILDGFIGVGRGDNDITDFGASADYDTDRWMAGVTLSKLYTPKDNVLLIGSASLIHADEDIDSYVLNNQSVDSEDSRVTQGVLNVELSSQYGAYEPYFNLGYEYDFKNSSASDNDADKSGLLAGGGFRYQGEQNLQWGMDFQAGSIGRDDESSYTLSADIRYTF